MNKLTLCSTLVLTALLTGCQSTSEKIAEQEQRAKVQNTRFSESETKVKAFQARLEQAKQDELTYFAPDHLEEAIDSFNDAKEDYDEMLADRSEATKSKSNRILENLQEANGHLDRAYQTKQNAQTILVESFDIRNQLNKLNASSLLPKPYRTLSRDIDEIVEDIADGDLEDARADNAKLLPKLRAFEVRIVKLIELKTVRAKAETLRKAKAKRTVPATHQQALSALANAESTITADPRNQEAISEAVKQANFQMDRASHMLQSVQELGGIKRANRETYLLGYETQLFNIAKELTETDLRNMPLKQQAVELAELAKAQLAKVAEAEAKVTSLQQSVAAGDAKGAQVIATLNQEKADLVTKLQQKDAEIKAQNDSQVSLQQNISALNAKISEMEQQDLAKQRKLLDFEKEKLALEQKIIELEGGAKVANAAPSVAASVAATQAQQAAEQPAPVVKEEAKAEDKPTAESNEDTDGIDNQ